MTEEDNEYDYDGHIYRAYPTEIQNGFFIQWCGVVRYLWNLLLGQRKNYTRVASLIEIHRAMEEIKDELAACNDKDERKAIRERMWEQFPVDPERRITRNTQSREVTELRKAVDYFKDVPSTALYYVVNNMDKAFKLWFKYLDDITKGKKPKRKVGYPKFKSKYNKDSFSLCRSHEGNGLSYHRLNEKWGAVQISRKIPNFFEGKAFTKNMHNSQYHGWMKFRLDEKWEDTEMIRLTMTRTPFGWNMSVGWREDAELDDELPNIDTELKIVAIDLGACIPIAWFDGVNSGLIELPKGVIESENRINELKRKRAKCDMGSGNYARYSEKIRKEEARKKRRTETFNKQAISGLLKKYDIIIFENIDLKAMTRSPRGTVENPGTNVTAAAKRNHGMLRPGLGRMRNMAKQKVARPEYFVTVPAPYTSIDCSKCGHRDPDNRTTRSLFECTHPDCDYMGHADVNAAKNIYRRGVKKLKEMGVL